MNGADTSSVPLYTICFLYCGDAAGVSILIVSRYFPTTLPGNHKDSMYAGYKQGTFGEWIGEPNECGKIYTTLCNTIKK